MTTMTWLMYMQIIQKITNKKFRYIFYSLTMSGLLLWVNYYLEEAGEANFAILLLFAGSLLGALFTQYPSITDYKGLLMLLPPLGLTLAAYFTLFHFPNFSAGFKTIGLVIVGVMFYLISLVNNIFLVVEEKEELIPLYRVAVTWSQIILVVVSIPLFTGIYKFNFSPLMEAFLVGLISFLYTLYFFWNLSFDQRTRKISTFNMLVNSSFSPFLVSATGLAVSFFPTEAFLRAIFSASVLLFAFNYLDGYMKNRINLKLIYHYGLIFLISLFIVLSFRP